MAVPADQGARLRGAVHHIGLPLVDFTGRNLVASAPFYDALLGFLGYTLVEREAAHSPRPRDRYGAGLHHLAFRAADRADVDRAYELMKEKGAALLDAPADFPQYGAAAAAAFGTDPDGLKLEVVPLHRVRVFLTATSFEIP